MRVQEITDTLGPLIISPEQSSPRSPGLHVSEVIHHIVTTMGIRDEWADGDQLNEYAQIGRVWEVLIARELAAAQFSEGYIRPGAIECDGLIGSPDDVYLDAKDPCICEYKVTWRSSAHDLRTKFRPWFWQVGSYCHMLGLFKAKLYALFVCGNWKPPVPCRKAWEINFSASELREIWTMMLRNAEDLQRKRSHVHNHKTTNLR